MSISKLRLQYLSTDGWYDISEEGIVRIRRGSGMME